MLVGLSLIGTSTGGWAAAGQEKAATASKKRVAKARSAKPRQSAVARPEIGAADIIAGDEPGIHGRASFYGHGFQGRKTATGDRFDVRAMTGASNHFPLGSWVAVRRLDNNRCVAVRINDRMGKSHRRVIDLSRGAAQELGMIAAGVVLVRVAPLPGASGREGRIADADCQSAFSGEEEQGACQGCGDRLPSVGEPSLSPVPAGYPFVPP